MNVPPCCLGGRIICSRRKAESYHEIQMADSPPMRCAVSMHSCPSCRGLSPKPWPQHSEGGCGRPVLCHLRGLRDVPAAHAARLRRHAYRPHREPHGSRHAGESHPLHTAPRTIHLFTPSLATLKWCGEAIATDEGLFDEILLYALTRYRADCRSSDTLVLESC